MNPLICFILWHAEAFSLEDLQWIILQVYQDEKQAVFGVGNGQFA